MLLVSTGAIQNWAKLKSWLVIKLTQARSVGRLVFNCQYCFLEEKSHRTDTLPFLGHHDVIQSRFTADGISKWLFLM